MATGNVDQQDAMLAFDGYNSQPENDDDESGMSLVEHLEELRWRIIKVLAAVVVTSIVAFVFRDWVVHLLELPLPREANSIARGDQKLVVTGLLENFTVYLTISIVAGIVLALPVLLYQTWAFIAPGLYEKEKKYAVPFIIVGVVLFAAGVALAYFVLRYPVEFFVTFGASNFTELVSADSYFNFVAFFMLAFGIVFELPLVLTFMALVDLISLQTLTKKRPVAHIGLWVASAVITPGADPYSPVILGVAMSFLYELTIIFIRIVKR